MAQWTPRALPLALAVGLAVAGVAYLGGLQRPPTFEALQRWTWATAPSGEAEPYLEALASPGIQQAIAAELLGRAPNADEVEAVGDWLSARADPAGVRIVVRGSSTEEVEARSAAVAETFEAWSIERDGERRAAELAAAQARLEEATERVRAAQVLGPAADGDLAALMRELDVALGYRDATLAALANGPTAPLRAGPELVRPRPSTAARDAAVAGAVAALLGLLAGVRRVAPLGRARRSRRADRTLLRARDGEPPGGLGVLARFPAAVDDDAPALRTPADALARAVSALDAPAPVVVLVVSLAPGAGKTTVACHLAEALARADRRVLLVDAALSSPALAERYALADAPNAAASRIASTVDWMQRPLAGHQVVRIDLEGERHLDLVPQFRSTRPAPGTGAALFGAFGDVLVRWRGYDVVVVDTAALEAVDDATHLARFATAAVVVTDHRQDGRRPRDEARRRLRALGLPLLGFVLDEPRRPAEVRPSAAGG